MKKILNFFFTFIFIIIILELVSYALYKINILEISHKPKFYLKKNYVTEYNFWNEENEWGAWRPVNIKTVQKRSCFNVEYKTNEVGARDSTFNNLRGVNGLLIGDSFAEGYGVNYKETSQYIIEKKKNVNIINLGISKNTGPVQYWLIYSAFKSKYDHEFIIIYFLPHNDFGENDYSNWKGSKRYRPYYIKKDSKYEIFIPNEAKKNYLSNTKKIKNYLKDFFWTSNLFINLNYQYKLYRSSKKKYNNFSAFFDAPLNQQKASIYFLDKIINDSNKKIFLVSIPRLQDYYEDKNINNVYWHNYYKLKDKNTSNFKFINLIDHPPKNLENIYLKCDGHWSPGGNKWAAEIISEKLMLD